MIKSPFIFDSPFKKTTFDLWDYLPDEDRARIRARRSMVKDYQSNYPNSMEYWTTASYADQNNNNVFDEGDELNYFMTVITSRDADLLNQITHVITPLPYEIIFLLEDNSRDTTAPVYYLRAGELVRANLATMGHFINLDFVLDVAIKKGIPKDQISKEILEKLVGSAVNSGSGHYKDRDWKEEMMDFLSPLYYGVSFVSDGIATGIKWVIDGIEHIKISPEYWNYELGDEEMKLFFFPFYSNEKVTESDLQKGFDEMQRRFDESIRGKSNELIQFSLLGIAPTLPFGSATVADGMIKDFAREVFSESLTEFKEMTGEIMELIDNLIEGGLVFVNAFLCGFWNSFVSLIQGILFLFWAVAKAIAFSFDKFSKPETFDHFVQLVQDFDYSAAIQLAKTLLGKVWNYLKNMDWDAVIAQIRVAHVGYFFGGLIEFIVEIVVGGLLFPAGGAALTLLKTAGRGLDGIIDTIQSILKGAFNLGKRDGPIDFSRLTLEILKAGKLKMTKAADDIWLAIKKWLDHLPLLLAGFSKELIDSLTKHGLRLKNYDPHNMQLMSILPIKMGKVFVLMSEDGRVIFVGTKKMVREMVEKIDKMADDEAKKFIDQLADFERLLAKLGITTDGQNWFWRNKSGTWLRWSRMSAKEIREKIEQKLKSDRKGDEYEAEVALALMEIAEKNGDEIVDFANIVFRILNKEKTNGDIDISTLKFIIEVKTNLGSEKRIKDLYNQLQKYLEANIDLDNKYLNPMKKEVIVVFQDMGTFDLNHPKIKELVNKGVRFIEGVENLKKLY